MTRFLLVIMIALFVSSPIDAQHGEVNGSFVLGNVFWMHIQKTSSWLGNFLLLWGCGSVRLQTSAFISNPMLYSAVAKKLLSMKCETTYYTGKFNFGYHVPHPLHMNGSTVTLFRNPYTRVVSSFLYGKGVHQIMFPLGFPNRAKVKFELREQIRESPDPIFTYAQLPGIASCQAKMVLGRECGEPATISPAQLVEAARRMRHDFAFVGLTEESEASARLFLAMYRPEASPTAPVTHEELINGLYSTPRANVHHTTELNDELLAVLRKHQWRDAPDEAVYAVAVELFFERCARYGIVTKHTKELLLSL